MRLYLFEWNGVSKVARGTRHAIVFRSIILREGDPSALLIDRGRDYEKETKGKERESRIIVSPLLLIFTKVSLMKKYK